MEYLKDFKSKGFAEQVVELTQISNNKEMSALPPLFSLYNNPIGDKPVDAMVEHTLRDLLNENEAETVAKITSGTKKERKLCIAITRVQKFSSSAQALVKLAAKEKNIELLEPVFLAMSEIRDPVFLGIFRANLKHPEETIAAISIGMIGAYKDEVSIKSLKEIIEKSENRVQYKNCSLQTGTAIEAMAAIGTDEVTAYLVSKIHHKNPTARRLVHGELAKMGESILPYLGEVFTGRNTDMQIMAANIAGRIGSRKGGDLIIAALDREGAKHTNVRFAIYEALGMISFSKGLVTLVEGLGEEEGLTLRAVVTSLENHFNPHIVKSILERISTGDEHSSKILHTIVSVKAVEIFTALYKADEQTGEKLTKVLKNSRDYEILDVFIKQLETMENPQAQSGLKTLRDHLETLSKGKDINVLAVDDSPSMLSFYRSICTGLDFGVSTAENGRVAWEILEENGDHFFQLMIVDMNMPEMDGIELTQKIRASDFHKDLPIIMGTSESDKSQVRMAKKSGVNEFIIKPIQPAILEKKIHKLLKI
jgi:CheY-like chemotaxis protein